MLLVTVFDMALQFGANLVTLEVRMSNDVAQSLYRTYGFKNAGVGRKYYVEDGEDGLVSRYVRRGWLTLLEQRGL